MATKPKSNIVSEDTRARMMIASPDKWPVWPRLPLMRINGERGNEEDWWSDQGYLVEGGGLTVFLGNIYFPPTGHEVSYDSVEALLKEWRVD